MTTSEQSSQNRKLFDDSRIVMTLDAGGTNFVFSALQGGSEVVEPVTFPSHGDDLNRCLHSIESGFRQVERELNEAPAAISFAFPGPADYPAGIIGDLSNLPCFRGGIALGPMLEQQFGLPVFINNDGDLFAYGEAVGGLMPEINAKLNERGISRRYRNLFGVTLGTGFGGGIVTGGRLLVGDNSAAGEVWATRNFMEPGLTAEEGVSIRAIRHWYRQLAKESGDGAEPTPRDIYEIARGRKEGDRDAAQHAFLKMAEVLAESLANAVTLIDGVMVIGGGISGAWELFLPRVVEHLNGTIARRDGHTFSRLISTVYNLEDPAEEEAFYSYDTTEIKIPFSEQKVTRMRPKRLPIGVTRLGTGRATSLGAYAFALDKI